MPKQPSKYQVVTPQQLYQFAVLIRENQFVKAATESNQVPNLTAERQCRNDMNSANIIHS